MDHGPSREHGRSTFGGVLKRTTRCGDGEVVLSVEHLSHGPCVLAAGQREESQVHVTPLLLYCRLTPALAGAIHVVKLHLDVDSDTEKNMRLIGSDKCKSRPK